MAIGTSKVLVKTTGIILRIISSLIVVKMVIYQCRKTTSVMVKQELLFGDHPMEPGTLKVQALKIGIVLRETWSFSTERKVMYLFLETTSVTVSQDLLFGEMETGASRVKVLMTGIILQITWSFSTELQEINL